MPYFLTALLFGVLAALGALDSALVSLNMAPWFNGLRWLRVHFVTLGVLAEAAFGLLPALAAAHANQPRPRIRWDIWLALTAGLFLLLIGIPLINAVLIVAGGTLIFLSAVLLASQIHGLTPDRRGNSATPSGRRFYLAGLAFLLLGVTFGAGLWLGWGEFLRAASPREVHIHSNLWGFTSLTFAGLLIDLYPGFAKRPLAWPHSVNAIFWMFVTADIGLVIGPWLGSIPLIVASLALHHLATAWLLLNVVEPLAGDAKAWTPGMLHLVAGYVWILSLVMVAPFGMMPLLQEARASVELNAPALLVYGWVLQVAYALAPYAFSRLLLPGEPARLGGNWFSLITIHLGGLFYLPGIVLVQYQAPLHAVAYLFWALSLLPVLAQLWRIGTRVMQAHRLEA